MLALRHSIALVLLLPLTACFHVSTMNTARLVPDGKARVVAGTSLSRWPSRNKGLVVTPEAEIRGGILPGQDAALRLSAAGEVAVDVRLGLIQSPMIAMTLGGGLGLAYPWRAATADHAPDLLPHLRLPFQASVHPTAWLAVYGDVTAHYLNGGLLSTTGGIQLGERFGVVLEVSDYGWLDQGSTIWPAVGLFAGW